MSKPLTPQELADFLSIEISTVYKWSSRGLIPTLRAGGRLRFEKDTVLEALRKRSESKLKGPYSQTIFQSVRERLASSLKTESTPKAAGSPSERGP